MAGTEGGQNQVTRRRETMGPVQAGILTASAGGAIANFLFWLIDQIIPLKPFFDLFPIIPRAILVVALLVFLYLAVYYFILLGGVHTEPDSVERQNYDNLRKSLASGGSPARVYRRWLQTGLDAVDHFFGDPGRNDRSFFARLLGLETPGARWTAPAFDKCLALAVVYSSDVILLVWLATGHAGVTSAFLGLPDPASSIQRAIASVEILLATALALSWDKLPVIRIIFLVGTSCWFASNIFFPDFLSRIFNIDFFYLLIFIAAYFSGGVITALIDGAIILATIGGSIIFAEFFYYHAGSLTVKAPAAACPFGFVFIVVRAKDYAAARGRLGLFLGVFTLFLLSSVFAAVVLMSRGVYWSFAEVLLLMFVLLPLINAPFDWFALGLTRGLLRRGLAPGGLGPFAYALIDALISPLLLLVLALVCVVMVQAFDDLAALSAGSDQARVFPLGPFFWGLQTQPGSVEFLWVWFMLFSTMIPSMFNLAMASAAFIRGFPFVNGWLLSRIPADGSPMPESDRFTVAIVLAGQIAGGAFLSGLGIYALAVCLFRILLPDIGTMILGVAEQVATLDLPARLMQWLAAQ